MTYRQYCALRRRPSTANHVPLYALIIEPARRISGILFRVAEVIVFGYLAVSYRLKLYNEPAAVDVQAYNVSKIRILRPHRVCVFECV